MKNRVTQSEVGVGWMSPAAIAINRSDRSGMLGVRFRSVAAVAILALASGACGGDDSNSPTQPPSTETPSAPASSMTPANDPAPVTPAETPAGPSSTPPGAAAESPPIGSVPLDNPPPAGEEGSNAGAGEGEAPPAPNEGEETPPEPTPEPPAAFNPCPSDGTPCRIMPLGDSITDGLGSANPGGGYRVELFRQAVQDGHDITFVGTRPPNGPTTDIEGQPFPRNHEGISGNTIQQVAGRVDAALAANPPDIVLLHIGTNNLYTGLPAGIQGLVGDLLDQLTAGAPDALVVVAQIIPGESTFRGFGGMGPLFNDTVQTYNAALSALVDERVAEGKHLVLVDMFAPFASNPGGADAVLNDVVHPNNAGYAIMAENWYETIESFLP
jgi:lysophospholipase L1-like esterase